MNSDLPREPKTEEDARQFLGVEPGATTDEIHAAYRELSRKYHPDRNNGQTKNFTYLTKCKDLLERKSITKQKSDSKKRNRNRRGRTNRNQETNRDNKTESRDNKRNKKTSMQHRRNKRPEDNFRGDNRRNHERRFKRRSGNNEKDRQKQESQRYQRGTDNTDHQHHGQQTRTETGSKLRDETKLQNILWNEFAIRWHLLALFLKAQEIAGVLDIGSMVRSPRKLASLSFHIQLLRRFPTALKTGSRAAAKHLFRMFAHYVSNPIRSIMLAAVSILILVFYILVFNWMTVNAQGIVGIVSAAIVLLLWFGVIILRVPQIGFYSGIPIALMCIYYFTSAPEGAQTSPLTMASTLFVTVGLSYVSFHIMNIAGVVNQK